MTKSGANINYYYICDMLNIPFEVSKANHKYIISEVRHLQLLMHKGISLKDWFADLKKSDGFTWKYEDDKKPFYVGMEHAVFAGLRARIKRLIRNG